MSFISERIGSLVTIRQVGQTLNDQGDATESYTDHSMILAVVQIMDGTELLVQEGQLQIGDAEAFFDYDATTLPWLTPGNRVYYQTVWYEIRNVIKEQIGETIVFLDVHCKMMDANP